MAKYYQDKVEPLLIRNLSKGNILAFNTLFREYSVRLYRFSYGYLKSEAESEELVQEVFIKIWEKRKEIREETSFRSYLFTIAFNIIKKHFRRKYQCSEYFKSEIYNDLDLQTSDQITYDSLQQFIVKLVDQLPERRKEIFIKSRFEGKNVREIAEELKISHKTVENQLTDALKFIRTHLNKEGVAVFLFLCLFIL